MDEATTRIVVKEAVEQTLERMGFTVDEPNKLQADMIYVRKAREGSEEVQKWIRRTAISVAITGMLYSIWQELKHSMLL